MAGNLPQSHARGKPQDNSNGSGKPSVGFCSDGVAVNSRLRARGQARQGTDPHAVLAPHR
jgi:hypothetical protein